MKEEEVKNILKEALWVAYCTGRADGKYYPEEVLPDLIKRCQLFQPPDELPKCDWGKGNCMQQTSDNRCEASMPCVHKEILQTTITKEKSPS